MKKHFIIYFTGKGQDYVSKGEYMFCKELGQGFWPKETEETIGVLLYNAPEKTKHTWAEYKYDDNDDRSRYTCETKKWVHSALRESAQYIYDIIDELENAEIIFCGLSNGCIPAYEFAKWYNRKEYKKRLWIRGCVLINGCPSIKDADLSFNKNFYRQYPSEDYEDDDDHEFPMVMCIAKYDSLWMYGRFLLLAAWRKNATVLRYNGLHRHVPDPKYVADTLLLLSKTNKDNKNINREHWKEDAVWEELVYAKHIQTDPDLNTVTESLTPTSLSSAHASSTGFFQSSLPVSRATPRESSPSGEFTPKESSPPGELTPQGGSPPGEFTPQGGSFSEIRPTKRARY